MKKYILSILFIAISLAIVYFYLQYLKFDIVSRIPDFCDANESGVKCFREWINPIAALFTMIAIWYAARSVVEANRASDAAVRSTLDTFRQQLTDERKLVLAIMESDEFQFLSDLRGITRGGWIHAREDYDELTKFASECSGFSQMEKGLEAPAFGGELGQRRKELSRLIDRINIDYFQCKEQLDRSGKVDSEILDNLRFRTKAFIDMFYSYQYVVSEEIDVTAEAINEYDDENLHRVRTALIDRAERLWDKRRKGLFERFLDRISVPVGLIDRPKNGNYFEDETGISPRAPSPHHVNKDFQLMPNREKK